MIGRTHARIPEEAKLCRANPRPFGPARDGKPGRERKRPVLDPAPGMPEGGRSPSASRVIRRARRRRSGHRDARAAAEDPRPLPVHEGRDDFLQAASDRERRPQTATERRRHPGRPGRAVRRCARISGKRRSTRSRRIRKSGARMSTNRTSPTSRRCRETPKRMHRAGTNRARRPNRRRSPPANRRIRAALARRGRRARSFATAPRREKPPAAAGIVAVIRAVA